MVSLPLDEIKVIDLTRLGPGPFCTMILADLGADVIWIEAGGGRSAELFSSVTDEQYLRARAYDVHGRNKRSIVLNLKSDKGRSLFHELARDADVIVEGFRPGAVKRLGVDYETVSGINPRIVYCSITGYGQDGPYSTMPGHDINYTAIAGALGIIGIPGGPPVLPSNLIGDFAGGGMNAVIGILAALMGREKTGKGQYVDISVTDGVVSLMSQALAWYFDKGEVPERGNDILTGGLPCYNVYETSDNKYISIGCMEPWFYENLCRILGREDFIPFQWGATEEKTKEMFSAFAEIFRTKTRDEWFDLLSQNEICTAKVYNLDEVPTDPQLLHRNMVVELDHPTFGKVRQAGISVKLSDTPGTIRSFAPLPGQHTDEVLMNLGHSKERIKELRNEGVIA